MLIQTKSQNAGSYSNTNVIVIPRNVAVGNTMAMFITAGSADTISTVVDNLGNTYTSVVSSLGGDRLSWLYTAPVTTAGACTITITFAASTFPDSCVTVREYSGIISATPDKTAANNDGASLLTTHDCGTTATTTQAAELVIAGAGSSGSADPAFAAAPGFGNFVSQNGFDIFTYHGMTDKTINVTGAQNTSLTTTAAVKGQGLMATFKLTSVQPDGNAFSVPDVSIGRKTFITGY